MGGSIQRITIIPIGIADSTEARSLFANADVSKCKCYLEADRQRLLGIVERGFGSFAAFNQMIQVMFQTRFKTVAISSKSQKSINKQTEKISFKEDAASAVSETSSIQPYAE
jgi:hypothetical protein